MRRLVKIILWGFGLVIILGIGFSVWGLTPSKVDPSEMSIALDENNA